MTSIAKTIEITADCVEGGAPEWVRRAWKGCIIPTATLECGHIPRYVRRVSEDEPGGLVPASKYFSEPEKYRLQKTEGYTVLQAHALEALKQRDPKAHAWWHEHGYPKAGAHENAFRFRREEVRVVDTYSLEELKKFGPLVVYDDMETGTMRPMT